MSCSKEKREGKMKMKEKISGKKRKR